MIKLMRRPLGHHYNLSGLNPRPLPLIENTILASEPSLVYAALLLNSLVLHVGQLQRYNVCISAYNVTNIYFQVNAVMF